MKINLFHIFVNTQNFHTFNFGNPRAFLVTQLGKNLPVMQETPVQFLDQEDPLEKGQATYSSIFGLPGGSDGKESTCNVGHLGLIPGLGRSPGEENAYPLQIPSLDHKESDTTE